MNVFPDVVLQTGRLILRPLSAADADDVHRAGMDDLTQTWLPLPQPYTRAHAEAWCAQLAPAIRDSGKGSVLAVELDGRFAGSIDLKRTEWLAGVTEISYWTSPWARSQGVMTEAVRALALWALRDVGLHRVELRIAPGNAASLRVAEKAGFHREGTARSAGYVHAGRVDLVIFSLIRSDVEDG